MSLNGQITRFKLSNERSTTTNEAFVLAVLTSSHVCTFVLCVCSVLVFSLHISVFVYILPCRYQPLLVKTICGADIAYQCFRLLPCRYQPLLVKTICGADIAYQCFRLLPCRYQPLLVKTICGADIVLSVFSSTSMSLPTIVG